MTVDAQKHLDDFRNDGRHEPTSRFTSFDYCYNYFQDARHQGATGVGVSLLKVGLVDRQRPRDPSV